MSKEQAIVDVTRTLLEASRVRLKDAIVELEKNYNPYHRVFYPFTVLFRRTSIAGLKNLKANDKLPDYIYFKNYQINIAKILDNSFHYMKPLDRMAISDGFQGAYVEDKGVSLTIPSNKLTRELHSKYMYYMSWVNKFKLPGEKIKKMIQGIINNYNVQYYNHIKLTYSADEYPPEYFIHKLRRDLSTYYKNLGYSAVVKNKDGSELEKSCDFYYDRNVETLPGKKKPVILKIYFIPSNLPFELKIDDKNEKKTAEDRPSGGQKPSPSAGSGGQRPPLSTSSGSQKPSPSTGSGGQQRPPLSTSSGGQQRPPLSTSSGGQKPSPSTSSGGQRPPLSTGSGGQQRPPLSTSPPTFSPLVDSKASPAKPMSFEEQKQIILRQWEQNQLGGLFSNILTSDLENTDTVSGLLAGNSNHKGASFIDFIRNNTQSNTSPSLE